MPTPAPLSDSDSVPRSYLQWRHCIEVECRIPLTPAFIAARQVELANLADYRTEQFIRLYGEPHRQRVLGWFAQAADDPEPPR